MLNTQIPDIFQCRIYQLNNGLNVILSSQDDLPVLTSVMLYPVGLRQEKSGQHGMSHFIEHMLFKGTQRFGKGEIDRISLQCGGNNNAYTSLDATIYTMNIPSEYCELVLEIEADRMVNPLFDPEEVAAEREVILEEWRTAEDDPDDAFWQHLSQVAMGEHPYGNPVLGYEKDIRGFDVESLKAFFKAHYQPQLATLILVGKLPDNIEALIEKHFGAIPHGNTVLAEPSALIPLTPSSQKHIVQRRADVNTPRLVMCWPAPAFENADYFSFLVLQYMLTEGWSSQLHALWVEKKAWASQVSSFIFESKDPYLFGIEVETLQDQDLKALEITFEKSLRHLKWREEDLAKAKVQLMTDLFSQQETTEQRAEFIADCFAAGSETLFSRYFESLQAVRLQDIQHIFKTYLKPEYQITAWLLPEEAQL
jgi:zinc protease